MEGGSQRVVIPIRFKDDGVWSSNLPSILTKYDKKGIRTFPIEANGGNTWFPRWQKVRKAFGESTVKIGGWTGVLKELKVELEQGGLLEVVHLRAWKPQGNKLKQILIGIMRNPGKLASIYEWDLKVVIRLYNVVRDFGKKSTRKYMRRQVSRIVREGLVVKTKYDARVKLVELHKVVNDCITTCELPECFRNRARRKVRIVQTKNLAVKDLLHNQRAYAAQKVLICTCADLPYPREGGHVRFRFSKGEDRHVRMGNANDIPRATVADRAKLLKHEVEDSFANWYNFRGNISKVSRERLVACISSPEDNEDRISVMEVASVKRELTGFVITPLDKNPEETVAICPAVYHKAMMDTFANNPGYRVMTSTKGVILREIREDVEKEGLKHFVRWDKKGEFGKTYVLPKHKDLDRYCPICPAFNDPMVKTLRLVAKALNHLLFTLPKDWHFNMQAVEHMVGRLARINKKLKGTRSEGSVEAMPFDIKEMFSKLPHEKIRGVVDWIVEYHKKKGRRSIMVNPRGKGSTSGRTTGKDCRRELSLDDLRKFVALELQHTYTKATGVLLRQDVGIPMGKNTSPPLACILYAYAEYTFIVSLGRWRNQVFDIRLMGDVEWILGAIPQESKADIVKRFKECYPDNLVLKWTNDGCGNFEFLGCEIKVSGCLPCVGSIQQSKDEQSLWAEEKIVFQNGQTFRSWS
ncbi:hypothetical protein CBR_g22334 [Chara braunii]|uniref:Reverse transcriptase domain-containing protein n=1 Tax=Chara braunii TaxID=69332 RepID=A0A388JUU7_CHABU|nr:hypothetical protein CBR_g22334 [Chara braunii]|eukprot:GBG61537.1 hypothetical protein CBR_g22334 [Chara braunii]